jgi:uncharacterized protein YjbI with pentapeptide repeats
MTETEADIAPFARAYERLRTAPLPPEDPDAFAVDGILEETVSEILRVVESSGRLDPVFWIGAGGTGVSTVLSRLAVSAPLADRYWPIPLRLAESVHLLDFHPADLGFVAYLALMEAAPAAGIDPSSARLDERILRDMLGDAVRKAATEAERQPDHLRRRLRTDGRFRARLREEFAADPGRLPAELADLAAKFSRNTVGAFRLDENTLARLRDAEVSERVLAAAGTLAGRSFRGEVGFFRELEKAVGEIQALHYRPLFLEHAWVEEPRDPLLLVDDAGKLVRGAMESLWSEEAAADDRSFPFGRSGVKVLVALPPVAERLFPDLDLRKVVLRPVALRNRDGRPDAGGMDRLREVVARRLDPEIAPGEALGPLIRGGGGVLRDLLVHARYALASAAARGRDRLTPDIAEASVRELAALRLRFFDRSGHGPALDRIGADRSLDGVAPAEIEYLLRYGFVLPYAGPGGEIWYEPHPAHSSGRDPGSGIRGPASGSPAPDGDGSPAPEPPASKPGARELGVRLSLGAAGVFAMVCPDSQCRDLAIAMEADSDADSLRPMVRLDLSATEADPAILKPAARPEDGRIVQVFGIEHLSEARRLDILGRLQIMLEAPSDAVLVWMPVAFERQLFFLAPELHSRLHGVFDSTPPGGESPSRSRRKPPALPPEAAERFYRAVLDQYENWNRVRRSGEEFLIPEMAAADLHAVYRPAFFANKQGKIFRLDDLLDRFPAERNLNFLAVLGGQGAGKTAFALQYYIRLVRRYLAEPAVCRMPVFLSLGGIAGRLNVEAHLIERFEACFGARLSVLALQDQLLRGRFVFVADGFDEMASAGDRYLTETHLEALARLSMKNVLLEDGVEKPQPANKVLLTCRPHYFLEDAAGGSGEFTALFRVLIDDRVASKNFHLVRLLPKFFADDADFRDFARHAIGDGIAARNLVALVERASASVPEPPDGPDPSIHPGRSDRSDRPDVPVPLLREMVARTAPVWRDRAGAGLAELLRAYTGLWCERDDWRSRLTAEGRRALLRRMALRMVAGEGESRPCWKIRPPEDLPVPPAEHIRDSHGGAGNIAAEELLACEFVRRDPDGFFRFVHPAFAYYFCAESGFDRIRRERDRRKEGGQARGLAPTESAPVSHERLGPDVRGFLSAILAAEKNALENLNLSGAHLENANLYRANLRGVRLDRALLSGAVLVNAVLAGADLTAADLSGCRLTRADLSDVDLSGANLSGTRLREADLSGARLNGADLRDADLRGAKMRGVRAAWVDFREADLSGADLSEANLSDATLSGVRLPGVRLQGAQASGANFSGADLVGMEAAEADFSGADFSGADLSEGNLAWADLSGAIFTGARLRGARLRESRLERAALNGVAASRADFRMARMNGVRMADAVLREADLSGADLKRARLERSDLSWANLSGARMESAELTEARLDMAKLMDASLPSARLARADLTWADLSRADLSGADLSGADLSEADLTGARLVGARMEGAICRETRFAGADLTDAISPPAETDGSAE